MVHMFKLKFFSGFLGDFNHCRRKHMLQNIDVAYQLLHVGCRSVELDEGTYVGT